MLLRTENLTKYFNAFPALRSLDMTVEEGSIVGFVGPNGAGKTTAMRIISTLMKATAGEVYINDKPITQNIMETRKTIGFVPDYFGVYDAMTAEEYLDFYAGINKINKNERKKLIEDMLELVNLTEKSQSNVNKLSRGMKQRLSLARCLLHDPQLLILDEPASGLDPQARADLKYILRALRETGKSVLISSHILPELGEFCDKVIILKQGVKLAEGSIDEISNQLGEKAKISYTLLKEDDFEAAAAIARMFPQTGNIFKNNMTLEIEFSGTDEETAELTRRLVVSGILIVSINRTQKTLEEVFLEVIDDENKNI